MATKHQTIKPSDSPEEGELSEQEDLHSPSSSSSVHNININNNINNNNNINTINNNNINTINNNNINNNTINNINTINSPSHPHMPSSTSISLPASQHTHPTPTPSSSTHHDDPHLAHPAASHSPPILTSSTSAQPHHPSRSAPTASHPHASASIHRPINLLPPKPPTDLSKMNPIQSSSLAKSINGLSRPIPSSPNPPHSPSIDRSQRDPPHTHHRHPHPHHHHYRRHPPSSSSSYRPSNRARPDHQSPSPSWSRLTPNRPSRPHLEADSYNPTYLSPDRNPIRNRSLNSSNPSRSEHSNHQPNSSYSRSISPNPSSPSRSRSRPRSRSSSRERPPTTLERSIPSPTPSSAPSRSSSIRPRRRSRSSSPRNSPSSSSQLPAKRRRPLSPSSLHQPSLTSYGPIDHVHHPPIIDSPQRPPRTTPRSPHRPSNHETKSLQHSPSNPPRAHNNQFSQTATIRPNNLSQAAMITQAILPASQANSNPSTLPHDQNQSLDAPTGSQNSQSRHHFNMPSKSSSSSARFSFQNYRPTFFFHRIPESIQDSILSEGTPFETDQSKALSRSTQPPQLTQQKELSKPSNDPSTKKKYFVGVSSIESYELIEKLGEGTFGEVFKGIYRGRLYAQKQKLQKMNNRLQSNEDPNTLAFIPESSEDESGTDDRSFELKSKVKPGMVVALKRIIVHNELDGLPITALREIRILKSLDHPNIVPVVDLAYSNGKKDLLKRGNTYMVFPYIDHDLAGLLENKSITFNVSQIKLYSKQLLLGTAYLHRNKILHRDLKAANLLISNAGQLMIADFGLARSIEQHHRNKQREYTNCVVTRWYRPPEILLGNRRYGTPVDMWGIGCVIAEMFKGGPILTGASDVNQCELIFRLCGSPTTESMPGWEKLPGCEGVRSWNSKPRRVREEYDRLSPELADLLDHLLVLDPSRRLTAEQALDHDWFWTDPMAIDPAKLPHYEPSHEYDRRKKLEQNKKPHQHQIASFTKIQGTSSTVAAQAIGGHPPQASKSHRLPPPGTNSKGPPPPYSNVNPAFPDHTKLQDAHPVGARMSYDPGSQAQRDGVNHGGNPYDSYPPNGMMVPKDGRAPGDNRHRYRNPSRSMISDPNRGGVMSSLPPHSYSGPPSSLSGGPIPSIGNPIPPMAGFAPPSLPVRPVSTYDRGSYDSGRPPKSGPISMMTGGVNGPVGGMVPGGHPYPHPHPHPHPHPEPFMIMGGSPPVGLLPEHASGDERGIPTGYGHPPLRSGYNGGGPGYGHRGSGNGRTDGRSRPHHDRWSPEATSQLGPTVGANGLPHPNQSYPPGRMAGGDRRQGGNRRYRNPNGGTDNRGAPYPPHRQHQLINHHRTNGAGGSSNNHNNNPYSSCNYPNDPMVNNSNINPFNDPAHPHPHPHPHPPPHLNHPWDNKLSNPTNANLDFHNSHPQPPHHHHPGSFNGGNNHTDDRLDDGRLEY